MGEDARISYLDKAVGDGVGICEWSKLMDEVKEEYRSYEEWEAIVPSGIKDDALWTMAVYRKSLFLADLAWRDSTKLVRDRRSISFADQLNRAVSSISANVAEGYSKGTGRDRARFFEYALGSARESSGWYFKSRYILGRKVMEHRVALLVEVISLLLAMIPYQRGHSVHEEQSEYHASPDEP